MSIAGNRGIRERSNTAIRMRPCAPVREAEAVVVSEAPAHALADLGRERDARMLVVGSCGEGLVRAAIVGSTANKLLHFADRPVLVVPAP
jgi:nucleotide-binding universal stress UspA family protein